MTPDRIQHFDEIYYVETHEYDEDYYREAALRYLTFKLDGRGLDIGCGRGYIMTHLRRFGADAYGIDISRYATTHPMPLCEGRMITGDVSALPFIDDSFDWTVCRSVLEHLTEDRISSALNEIHRVSPWNVFLIAVLDNEHGMTEEFWKREDDSHLTIRSSSWWMKRFQEVGMTVEYYDGSLQFLCTRPRRTGRAMRPENANFNIGRYKNAPEE